MAYRYGNGVAGRLLTAIAAVAATAAMTLLAPPIRDPRMMTATLAGIAVAAAVALAGTAMLLASRGRRAAPAARHASDTAPRKEDDHTDRTGHPAPARPRPRHPK